MPDNRNLPAVGHKRPPTHANFKPGQSGNPRGRPKKARTFLEDLADELQQTVRVRINGVDVEISKQRAVVMAFVDRAMKAEARALGALIELIVPDETEDERPGNASKMQETILTEFVNEELKRRKQHGENDDETQDVEDQNAQDEDQREGEE